MCGQVLRLHPSVPREAKYCASSPPSPHSLLLPRFSSPSLCDRFALKKDTLPDGTEVTPGPLPLPLPSVTMTRHDDQLPPLHHGADQSVGTTAPPSSDLSIGSGERTAWNSNQRDSSECRSPRLSSSLPSKSPSLLPPTAQLDSPCPPRIGRSSHLFGTESCPPWSSPPPSSSLPSLHPEMKYALARLLASFQFKLEQVAVIPPPPSSSL
jgi:hypothetical protein